MVNRAPNPATSPPTNVPWPPIIKLRYLIHACVPTEIIPGSLSPVHNELIKKHEKLFGNSTTSWNVQR
jgi:hypothetical protein